MKNNKVYFPVDAIARHEDFDVWYEDGDVFLSLKGAWSGEWAERWAPSSPMRRRSPTT